MKINNIQEIIKKIEWKSLKKEGGTCEYVPETIAELVTNNQNDREKMYWQYDNNVVVQSYLYDGAFYLIPFLIEMLKADDIIEKKEVYNLLYEIGNGSAEFDKIVTYKTDSYPFEYYIPCENGVSLPLGIACRNAVLKGWNIYITEILNEKSLFRNNALELMFSFIEYKVIQKEVLEKLFEKEKDTEFYQVAKGYYDEIIELIEHDIEI
ncbi:hypothetical protein [Clostridium weizhouense]|uniref:Uncharacterized protein n=1 Tax=Clostridium weizhouense TaxID=2859781 RepID=A0ABS7ATH9_9CLOT|nr:hypothetical protein [Clostridium weizhouense]MBW6411963.1 hypothetical protein [Clostridium weizhouense]